MTTVMTSTTTTDPESQLLQPSQPTTCCPVEAAPTHEFEIQNRALNRKIDIALLPLLSLLYLFNGLDRGNVGNAETQGMRSQPQSIRYNPRKQRADGIQASPVTLALSQRT
ncbi:hypothetical protein AUP68_08018 [Ilyonectria robusta]